MKIFYFIALVLALALAPIEMVHAKGGSQSWLLGIDLSYLANKQESVVNGVTATGNDNSTTYYDLGLGYLLGSNLYVGGIYSTKNYSSKGATVSTSTSASAMGASVGWVFDNGFHVTGSYLLSATDGDFKKGSGIQMDFGWRNYVSSSFYVGAKLTYRSIKYTEYALMSGFESHSDTTTLPYISIGFGF